MRYRTVAVLLAGLTLLAGCGSGDRPQPQVVEPADEGPVPTELVEPDEQCPESRTYAFGEPIELPEGTVTVTAERREDVLQGCPGGPAYPGAPEPVTPAFRS